MVYGRYVYIYYGLKTNLQLGGTTLQKDNIDMIKELPPPRPNDSDDRKDSNPRELLTVAALENLDL